MNIHNYIFSVCRSLAKKSNDPSRGVGCVIVNKNNEFISVGYNKFPCWFDGNCTHKLNKDDKGALITHAEIDALNNISNPVNEPLSVYVSCHPCYNCAIAIINSKYNITSINYMYSDMSDTFINRYRINLVSNLLNENNIRFIEHDI